MEMLVQGSVPSSINQHFFSVSEHGKQQKLGTLHDWLDYVEARHNCSKFDECHHDECEGTISAREEKENYIILNPIAFCKTYSNTSLTMNVGETSALNNNDHVYKRRKKYNSASDLSSFSGGCEGVLSPIMPKEVSKTDLVDKGKAPLCRQPCRQNPNILKDQIVDSQNSDIVSESIKRFLASVNFEYGESAKSSSLEMSPKLIGKSQSANVDSSTTTDSLEISSFDDMSYSQFCKLCGLLDNTLKMLICDLCEESFHMSCCNPRVKKVPVDEWYCRACMKKKPKPLVGAMTASKPSNGISEIPGNQKKISLIMSMLQDTEPYTPGVRIGRAFQADVPDWCGPISKKHLSEVQTSDWDCSCSVLWDPVLSDCAVPQEPRTIEVLAQLKYAETPRPRLASKRHRLTPTKGVGSR